MHQWHYPWRNFSQFQILVLLWGHRIPQKHQRQVLCKQGAGFVFHLLRKNRIIQSKYSKFYRPVYRLKDGSWKRFETEVELNANEKGEIECVLEYTFKNEQENVQFALCYPYQYEKHLNYLTQI